MTTLILIDATGREHIVDAEDGLSVMEAVRPLSLGIDGECEGSVACATCHVWVDADWADRLTSVNDDEAGMLDCVFNARPTSRLSCQVLVEPSLNGLRMHIPKSQTG